MKDFNGVELKIGDEVIYADEYQALKTSKVLRFGKKKVILEVMGWSLHYNRYPQNLIINKRIKHEDA